MEFGTIREPIVEGIFYPDDPQMLEQRVRELLQYSQTPAGTALAIVAPHAGYDYCGSVIASAFKACAAREIHRVVILGPVHRDPEEAAFLPESGWYRTPLGLVPIQRELIRALGTYGPPLIRNDIPHLDEHSVEVLLPFLQYLFPHASIIPILIGGQTTPFVQSLSQAMRTVLGPFGRRDTLFVLSLNLTNYLDSARSQREAGRLIDMIISRDGEAILRARQEKRLTTCGAATLASFLWYAGDNLNVELLERGVSYTANRDRSNTVEYGAIGLY